MSENLIPMVVMTGMFAMIFGIVYIRSRENMAMIERGLNPRSKDPRPMLFINLKWGLLLIGSGLGLLFAYIINTTIIKHDRSSANQAIFTIGGHHTGAHANISIGGSHTGVSGSEVVVRSNDSTNDTALSISNNNFNDNAGNKEEEHSITEIRGNGDDNPALYFALIAIGGGLGLFFSYRIEKKEWLDKKIPD